MEIDCYAFRLGLCRRRRRLRAILTRDERPEWDQLLPPTKTEYSIPFEEGKGPVFNSVSHGATLSS